MAGTLGSYGAFINSMLGLREQRLKEEQLKQAERLAQQKQMMEMVGDIGSAITSGYNQFSQNKMANQMMTEQYGAPPRAQAVDPSMQAPADVAAARMPGFYTGGMPELKMRMEMDEFQSKDLARRADIYSKTQNLKFAKSKWLVDQATKAKTIETKPLQDAFKNNQSYIKDMRVYDDAIGNAKTPEEYQTAVDAKIALNQAAQQRGLKVDPIDPSKIAPFMSEDERTALETQQTAVSEARTALEEAQKAPPGLIDKARSFFGLGTGSGALGLPGIPTQQEGTIKTAQQLYEREQQKLRETPGASFYGEKPPPSGKSETLTEKPSTTGTAGGDNIPLEVGTRRRGKKSGRVQIWNGSEWVDE